MFIKELPAAECLKILAGKRTGRLACARENQPYVVPFHFVFDGCKYLYAFSTRGQKIDWMRTNPLVCVEVDDTVNQFEWISLVIFGRFEELTESTEFAEERARAYEQLSKYAMWWQPGYVTGIHHSSVIADNNPIYFRISVDKLTGHQAIPD